MRELRAIQEIYSIFHDKFSEMSIDEIVEEARAMGYDDDGYEGSNLREIVNGAMESHYEDEEEEVTEEDKIRSAKLNQYYNERDNLSQTQQIVVWMIEQEYIQTGIDFKTAKKQANIEPGSTHDFNESDYNIAVAFIKKHDF